MKNFDSFIFKLLSLRFSGTAVGQDRGRFRCKLQGIYLYGFADVIKHNVSLLLRQLLT
jgi:hypothetical protein